MQAYVKRCPKCAAPVEKDGGCNLVVCRACRQSFCWLCGSKTGVAHTWERIGGHTCGEWRALADQDIAQSKAKHKRYLHFYQHYSVRY
jgi:ariadne-1